MQLEWLWNWFNKWPKGVPQLYAPLSHDSLIPSLSVAECNQLLALPVVQILPLAAEESSERDIFLGLGISRRLIRDLALAPGLSVSPPDDLSQVFLAAVPQLRSHLSDRILVSGETISAAGFFRVELQVFFPDRPSPFATVIHETAWGQFLISLTRTVAQICGGDPSPQVQTHWQTAVPSLNELIALGEVLATTQLATPLRLSKATALQAAYPLLALTLPLLGEKSGPLQQLLRLYQHDPYDIALLLELFLVLSNQQRNDVPSVQFLRRALELSPGNGAAQRLAAVVDCAAESRLRRARVASRLLGLSHPESSP